MSSSFQSASACATSPRESLAGRYRAIRRATERLSGPLSAEDCQAQSMDDASPVKWHLAHTSWFFETFIVEQAVPGYRPFHPGFRVLFNSYYQSVGRQHPRPRRGLLTRPTLDEVFAYRAHVDTQMLTLLQARDDLDAAVVELGLQHEQQHQELILTDVKHLLASNPLRPAYRDCPQPAVRAPAALHWQAFGEGIQLIGHDGDTFAFDNERPRHRVFIESFDLASRLVTNGEFLAFIDDGGYERPELWLSDGWNVVQARNWRAPLYWEQHGGSWQVMTLAGLHPLRADEPVCHVSLYEADAFARWAGARLPREAEWEVAAADAVIDGNFVESDWLHPIPGPAGAAGLTQLFGDVWEWTQSAYAAYPGYQPPAGALGEYNGKFMCNQLVLRGGSCATPRDHVRATYRNFFPPDARWQFSGIRLAR
jgi:ergothioneine biosynthesis protein EgtB